MISVGLYFTSLNLDDAVKNLRTMLDYIKLAPPHWLEQGWLHDHARAILTIFALATLLWSLWPSKRFFALLSGKSVAAPTGPNKDWIPIASAPFVIRRHPAFATEDEGPEPAFLSKHFLDLSLASGSIDLPNPPGMRFNPGVPSMRILDGLDLVQCGVDWTDEAFFWGWERSEPRGRWAFAMAPWQFASQPLEDSLGQEVGAMVKARAASVWKMIQYPISTFLSEGGLVLWARIGKATEPFSSIPADAWRHYEVVDWPSGRAQSPSGEILFSVHVEIVRRAPRLTFRARVTQLAQSLLARRTATKLDRPPG